MKYQVFISFKRNALDGSGLTRDYQLALNLHNALIAKGINTFFSEKDLSTSAFREEIDKALDDAKILIVVGTTKENMESLNVKYEWNSFHDDLLQGLKQNCEIYTYIEGMNQKQLPRALRSRESFQSNQMDELIKRVMQNLNIITTNRIDSNHTLIHVPNENFLEKYKNIIIPVLAVVVVAVILFITVIWPTITNNSEGGTEPIVPDSGDTSTPEDTDTQDDTYVYDNSSATISVSRVGQTISFGSYEQDNITSNGAESLEWIVLDIRNNTALIITKYGIDNPSFNNSKTDTTWADSNLRKWMNNTFYNKAFSSAEQKAILEANVSSEKSLKWGINGGSSTQDKIFALSESETNKYFTNNDDRQTIATSYAESNGAMVSTEFFVNGKGATWWWLRNPGSHANEASYISGKGSIAVYGAEVNSSHVCARPAMWVAIN